jgi:hypothetical protein
MEVACAHNNACNYDHDFALMSRGAQKTLATDGLGSIQRGIAATKTHGTTDFTDSTDFVGAVREPPNKKNDKNSSF